MRRLWKGWPSGDPRKKLLIYSMCLMGLRRFWAKFQLVMAHIQSMLLNGSGMRGSGTGDGEPSPSPLDPMGIDFPRFLPHGE